MADATPDVDVPAKPHLRFRKLRIAVSVFFGLLTLLLCVLWVRSYWWEDGIAKDRKYEPIGVYSLRGVVGFIWEVNPFSDGDDRWGIESAPVQADRDLTSHWGFGWYSDSDALSLYAPHWFLIMLVGLLAAMPWVRNQFSLRNLLIATTIVALVLGLAVWAGR